MGNPLCCAAKCCGCILCSQLVTLFFALLPLILFIAAFELYIKPWGEDQICSALGKPHGCDLSNLNLNDPSLTCAGCALGVNTAWPTTTDGTLHFLDTSAGTTISSVVGVSLGGAAVVGAGSMLLTSLFPSLAASLSFAGGFYEMTHIVEQAQYIGMISQLQIRGAPEFLNQFSKQLAWTNLNVPKSISSKIVPYLPKRRLTTTAAISGGESGPTKYATMLGVEPENLFWYTVAIFIAVVVLIHIVYVVWLLIVSAINRKESFGKAALKWYRKVVWATILVLILAQYIFAMTGSYYIYQKSQGKFAASTTSITYVSIALALLVGFALIFGMVVVGNNTEELRDVGTYQHEQRPFATKYSAYYDEYNFDNRFFFVPRILLAIGTGAIVGVVQNPSIQLFLILGMTLLYLVLVIFREPNLLRFLFYVALVSVFMKVVLLCLMLVLVQDDYFPQNVRNKVSYAIIGINVFIFFLLFLRQAYVITYKLVRGCKNKGKQLDDDDDDDDDDDRVELGGGRGPGGNKYSPMSTPPDRRNPGAVNNDPYSQAQNQQQQQQSQVNDKFNGYQGQGQPNQSYGQEQQAAAMGFMAGAAQQQQYGNDPQQQRYQPDAYGDQMQSVPPKETEKYTWRRNIERRAAEAEAAALADQQARNEPSFMTFGSSQSGLDGTNHSNSDYYSSQAPNQTAGASQWDQQPNQQYGDSNGFAPQQSTGAWFNERSPTDLDASYGGSDATRDKRDEPLATRYADSYADSYSSFVSTGTGNDSLLTGNDSLLTSGTNPLDDGASFGGASDLLASDTNPMASFAASEGTGSEKMNHLAVEYLQQMGGNASPAENDLGDSDSEEETDDAGNGAIDVDDDDNEEIEQDDGDAADRPDESVDVDVDVDDDDDDDANENDDDADKNSDDEDVDIDIDSMPLRDNDSLLSSGSLNGSMIDSANIKKVDDIGIHDREPDLRRSTLNLAASAIPHLSQLNAPSSDDDISFYMNAARDETAQRRPDDDRMKL